MTAIREYRIKKGISQAQLVHHRNEIRQRPDLALSEYDDRGQLNTVIICPGCHWEEHHKRKLPVTEERW